MGGGGGGGPGSGSGRLGGGNGLKKLTRLTILGGRGGGGGRGLGGPIFFVQIQLNLDILCTKGKEKVCILSNVEKSFF